jgi:hypothetical protein
MGSPRPEGQGSNVSAPAAEAPLFVLLFVFGLVIVGFGTGKAHVPFIDAIFTEILLARYAFNQFVGFDFRPT